MALLRDLTRSSIGVPLRRAVVGGGGRWVRSLPAGLRTWLDVDGDVVRPLRVEIGGGAFPTRGYVHVDYDRRAQHLEYLAPAWKLPFADGSVAEILAVHVLEHVHPTRLRQTLGEWRRVLRPDGVVWIHVPNALNLFRAYETVPSEKKWALNSVILGMYAAPAACRPEHIGSHREPDHRCVFDLDLLTRVLTDAGFVNVEDHTGRRSDRHTDAWQSLVPNISLVVCAERGRSAA
jgi:SAM-dependent methyltransferase